MPALKLYFMLLNSSLLKYTWNSKLCKKVHLNFLKKKFNNFLFDPFFFYSWATPWTFSCLVLALLSISSCSKLFLSRLLLPLDCLLTFPITSVFIFTFSTILLKSPKFNQCFQQKQCIEYTYIYNNI